MSLNCESNPETTTVKNNTNKSITIETVGSIYKPRSNEPFNIPDKLGVAKAQLDPGETITFESGTEANQNVLTRQNIYNNDVGSQEGAVITTSTGERFIVRCGMAPPPQTNLVTSGPPEVTSETTQVTSEPTQSTVANHQIHHGETIINIPAKKGLPNTGGLLPGLLVAAGLLGAGLLMLKIR